MSRTVTSVDPVRIYDTDRDFNLKKKTEKCKRRKRKIIIIRFVSLQFYLIKRGVKLSLRNTLGAQDRILCGPKRKVPGRSSRNSPIIIRLLNPKEHALKT